MNRERPDGHEEKITITENDGDTVVILERRSE